MNNNIKIAKELVRLAKSLVASSIPDTPNEMADLVAERIGLTDDDRIDLVHDINNLRGDEWFKVIEDSGDKELLDIYRSFLKKSSVI